MRQYIVPRRVKAAYEVFPGVGIRELLVLCAGLVPCAVLWWLLTVAHAPGLVRVLLAALPETAVSVGVLGRVGDQTFGERIMAMRRWASRQRVYKFGRDRV